MPEGGKFIISTSLAKIEYSRSRLQPFVEPGEYILLAISDTGPGTALRLRKEFLSLSLPQRRTRSALAFPRFMASSSNIMVISGLIASLGREPLFRFIFRSAASR
jgi:hypothetical protein